MHSYLRAIGFSRYINRVRCNDLIDKVMESPDIKQELMVTTEETIFEFRKQFADNMGLVVHGIVNDKQQYEVEYFFPYFNGSSVQVLEEISIEKNISSISYYGACEDVRLGVSLIFYLQNGLDYLDNLLTIRSLNRYMPVSLSALALTGKILLPIKKTAEDIKKNKNDIKNKNRLIAAAKRGDEEAIEMLTISEFDTYSRISGRVANEDIYSIVDSSFIPYGVSCDRYSIIGTIIDVENVKNDITGEDICIMHMDCNDLKLDVAINYADLVGEPMRGRRFKGIIWLQGMIGF